MVIIIKTSGERVFGPAGKSGGEPGLVYQAEFIIDGLIPEEYPAGWIIDQCTTTYQD